MCWIIKGVWVKNLKATLLFVDFSKAFESTHIAKMEQIFLADSFHKETVTSTMILYKNTTAMIHLDYGDTNLFDIVTGVLQEDTLVQFLSIICQDYIQRISRDQMKKSSFTLKKAKSKWYPAEKNTYEDYVDDLVLLSNTAAQVESLLHSLEQAARDSGLYVNLDKTELMCFE